MSRKPPKKSDRGRPWRSGERRSARYVRVQMTRHLIVCEGTRTEPGYFNGLKAALGEANGRKVDVHHERLGNRRPSEKCPGTVVHTLFDELGPYLE